MNNIEEKYERALSNYKNADTWLEGLGIKRRADPDWSAKNQSFLSIFECYDPCIERNSD